MESDIIYSIYSILYLNVKNIEKLFRIIYRDLSYSIKNDKKDLNVETKFGKNCYFAYVGINY